MPQATSAVAIGRTCEALGGCDRPARAKGLCTMHYQRVPPEEMKYRKYLPGQKCEAPDGCDRPIYVKGLCAAHYHRRWRGGRPEKTRHARRNGNLKHSYGITPAYYDALLAKQGGVCAICGKPETVVDRRTGKPRRLAVDHDHVTGKVRGLLCANHNALLGHAGDAPEILLAAVDYLASPPVQFPELRGHE